MSPADDPERPDPAENADEAMPLPADPRIIFLGGIFFILLLAALYLAAEILWPLVFAFILSLLLNPLLRFLDKLHVPRVLGAYCLSSPCWLWSLGWEPRYLVLPQVGRQS